MNTAAEIHDRLLSLSMQEATSDMSLKELDEVVFELLPNLSRPERLYLAARLLLNIDVQGIGAKSYYGGES